MNFITLTLVNDQHMVVNVAHIVNFTQCESRHVGTGITFTDSEYIIVKESVEEIEKIIQHSLLRVNHD